MPANAIPFLPSLARNPPTIAPPSLAPKPGIGGGFLPDEGGLDLDLLRERVAALDEEMQMRLSAPPVEGEDTGLARFVIPILGAIGGLAMGGDAMSAAVGFGRAGRPSPTLRRSATPVRRRRRRGGSAICGRWGTFGRRRAVNSPMRRRRWRGAKRWPGS